MAFMFHGNTGGNQLLFCLLSFNLQFQYCDIFDDKLYCGSDPIN